MRLDRKKILIPVAVAAAAIVVLYVIVDVAVLSPAGDSESNISRLRGELRDLKDFNSRAGRYRRRLNDYAMETFGLVPLEVGDRIRARIDKMVIASGMRRGKATSTAITGKSKPNVYQEVGWSYDLIGTLRQAVNMMFLLKNDPYLHQVRGLSIKPTRDRKEVTLSFQYVTLVLETRKNEKLLTGDTAKPKPIFRLDRSKELPLYRGIVTRCLFRPYVRKAPPPAPPSTTAPARPPATAPAPAAWAHLRVVDLSQWGEKKDIRIEDTQDGEKRRYRLYNVGDSLAGGTIVMVDYRTMPMPGKPEILSGSRLILKIGKGYYAVELGRSLAEKYRLTEARLPPSLRGKPTSAPSGAGAKRK